MSGSDMNRISGGVGHCAGGGLTGFVCKTTKSKAPHVLFGTRSKYIEKQTAEEPDLTVLGHQSMRQKHGLLLKHFCHGIMDLPFIGYASEVLLG